MRLALASLSLALLVTGCSRASVAASAAGTPAQSIKVPQASESGAPYAKLRQRLVLDGWLPLHHASCAADTGRPQACNRWLELQRCDVSGHCSAAWGNADGTELMRLQLSGVPGDEGKALTSADVRVDGTEQVAPVEQAAAAARCPSTQFMPFLQAFAAQPALRRAFTVPLVHAKVLVSDGEGDRTETVYVRGERPDVFDVSYGDGAFHHVGIDGVDPAPLALQVKQPSAQQRDVSYLYGSSEGRSFRFTLRDGCWYLTGNPQPTGP
ncbi:hypothetical protein [Dyella sp.]|jgi:hypothetical protein|uniref:hypothetical protein n=1 Tax=Dyella sp. TaxID=1869338 RepID=UPI002D797502|nr:hypothetical protein [Dyella sp.]HET6431806.1 hypothetical protein [Dyella sp.]